MKENEEQLISGKHRHYNNECTSMQFTKLVIDKTEKKKENMEEIQAEKKEFACTSIKTNSKELLDDSDFFNSYLRPGTKIEEEKCLQEVEKEDKAMVIEESGHIEEIRNLEEVNNDKEEDKSKLTLLKLGENKEKSGVREKGIEGDECVINYSIINNVKEENAEAVQAFSSLSFLPPSPYLLPVFHQLHELRNFKVTIILSSIGNAPKLKQSKFSICGTSKFVCLVEFLKRALKRNNKNVQNVQTNFQNVSNVCNSIGVGGGNSNNLNFENKFNNLSNQDNEQLYVYINNAIQPQLDDFIADLFNAFSVANCLRVSYSFHPAY